MKLVKILQRKEKYKIIEKIFGDLGIQIFGIGRLSPELWNVIYESLIDLFNKYPIMCNGNISWIRVETKKFFLKHTSCDENTDAFAGFFYSGNSDDYVDMDQGIGITINKNQFNSLQKEEVLLKKKVNRNTMVRHILAHEFGHLLDLTISGYRKEDWNGIIKTELLDDKFGHQVSDDIVENALDLYFGSKDHPISSVIEEIGKDSVSRSQEIFAECIALNFSGIGKRLPDIVINVYHDYISSQIRLKDS